MLLHFRPILLLPLQKLLLCLVLQYSLGDNYDFAPDIYVGDRKFEAFPAMETVPAPDINGQPLFGEFARFSAICAYDPAIYGGNFEVVSDAFGNDFTAGPACYYYNS